MKKCDCCGNSYERSFQVIMAGKSFTFDSFGCAVHRLAPSCDHCNCKIVGHGIEYDGHFFCCAHCASQEGVKGAVDHLRNKTA